MSLIRARQLAALLRPTSRAISWTPLIVASVLAIGYVAWQAPRVYVDYRIQVLRLAALAICLGAAFALDDASEETIAPSPLPLVLRRLIRAALVVPPAAAAWLIARSFAGEVPPESGGPLPFGDLTLEATTIFVIAMAVASLGARYVADRFGGIVAAPAVLLLVAASFFPPPPYRLLLAGPSDPMWVRVHDLWQDVLVGSVAAFFVSNWDPGAPGPVKRAFRVIARVRTGERYGRRRHEIPREASLRSDGHQPP